MFKSRFEKKFSESLTKLKLVWKYEPETFYVMMPIMGGQCKSCNSKEVYAKRRYTPDFKINAKFFVETKGKFTSKDRTKILNFVQQHPEVNFRLFFMRDNKLAKNSKVTYSAWCTKHGITFAVGTIPKNWIKVFKDEGKSKTSRREPLQDIQDTTN